MTDDKQHKAVQGAINQDTEIARKQDAVEDEKRQWRRHQQDEGSKDQKRPDQY